MTEEWRPVKGYEGIYEVSSLGRVRSLSCNFIRKDGSPYRMKGRILKAKTRLRHYAKVRLCKVGQFDTEAHIHRLVAEAFLPNPEGLPHVRHKNCDLTDNRADNLEWSDIVTDLDTLEGEEWRPAYGYESKYEVSNLGRVRSIDHFVRHPAGQGSLYHGRILKQTLTPYGYYVVTLHDNNGAMRHRRVHQLVARAFCDGWFEGAIVNHKDVNTKNNRADNLEWCTYKHNNEWDNRIGKVQQRFIDSGHAKRVVQYDTEGNFIAEYPSVQEAARQTGLNRNSINQCLWGNCKRAKEFIFKYKHQKTEKE